MYVGTLNTEILYGGAICSILLFWGVIGAVAAGLLYYVTTVKPKIKKQAEQVDKAEKLMSQMLGQTIARGQQEKGRSGTSTTSNPTTVPGDPLPGNGPWTFESSWGQTFVTPDRTIAEKVLADGRWEPRW